MGVALESLPARPTVLFVLVAYQHFLNPNRGKSPSSQRFYDQAEATISISRLLHARSWLAVFPTDTIRGC